MGDDGARKNIGVRLLPHTIQALDDAAARLGKSRAFVIEVLVGLHAAKIDGKTSIPIDLMPAGGRIKKSNKKK